MNLKDYSEDAGRFFYSAEMNRLEARCTTFDQTTQRDDSFRPPQ
ncbi:MAG: hypothetical protein WA705_18090 [Candidatus Ozemobacteraceae bacterium]